MAVTDIKKYAQELLSKHGVPTDRISAVVETLGDPTVEKAFREGFVAVPDHHSTIDKMKGEWEGKVSQYDKWYNETALPAHQQALKLADRYQKYVAQFGELDETGNGEVKTPTGAGYLTKKDLDEALKQRDQAYVGLTKTAVRVGIDYYNRFHEPLDVDALEQLAIKSGLPLEVAYERFIAPKVEEATKTEWEAKLKSAREEGARDERSRLKLPVESGPREAHPFFDRKPVDKAVLDPERAAREAFLETLRQPAGTTK